MTATAWRGPAVGLAAPGPAPVALPAVGTAVGRWPGAMGLGVRTGGTNRLHIREVNRTSGTFREHVAFPGRPGTTRHGSSWRPGELGVSIVRLGGRFVTGGHTLPPPAPTGTPAFPCIRREIMERG